MADEKDQAGSQTGAPAAPAPVVQQAVPQPVSSIRPPASAEQARPEPPSEDGDPRARVLALRAEADALESQMRGDHVVNIKVEAPHAALLFGGLYVGNEFTPVPRSRLADLERAAADAGAVLTTEG